MSITTTLQQVQAAMADRGDHLHATQIGQLLDKLHRNKAVIAMCGHFSAGKSSLINTMCGATVLASGPIPTSANLVMIENVEHSPPEAIVQYKTGTKEVIPTQVGFQLNTLVSHDGFISKIDGLSKNGLEVERIDIHLSVPLLADQLILMDTPGVDSTDDAHRMATESALHLADVVFYVTDYNHVQSEVNFNFTKRLKDWGKPVYIIINQVDKHNEQELSFERFVADVKNAFADWGIVADGYLFISVKQPEHPRSEWYKLMELFEQLKAGSEAIVQASVILSCTHLVKEHVAAVYPEHILPELDRLSLTEVKLLLDQLHVAMEQAHQGPLTLKQQFRDELTRLVNNANIMPATARDLAGAYLQSRKPGFRVGLLFSDTKTKAEAAERLRLFTEMVQDHTDKQLVWHLNHLLQSYKQLPEISPLLQKQRITIPDIQPYVTSEWIASQVNMASGFTNEYTMIFTSQLTEHMKSSYRKQATELFEYIAEALREDANQSAVTIQARVEELTVQLTQLTDAHLLEEERNEYQTRLLSELEQINDQTMIYPDPDRIVEGDHSEQLTRSMHVHSSQGSTTSPSFSLSILDTVQTEIKQNHEMPDKFQYRTIMEQMAERLSQSADLLEPLQSITGIRRSLLERAKKLKEHQFTIALFGAFSAGKSSFANALMGQSILPVSPNPTTAAINRIVPVSEQWPHLSARIRMKSIEAVLADIRYSFNMLGDEQSFESIEHAVSAIRSIAIHRVTSRGKAHLSFLQAIERGWHDIQLRLGTEWMANEEEYRQYVANESKSCFVERIDLHYSSTFTDQGVILVDTPGADSIHARHTGVAFDYIKNADAILFVTYYNHAFSQSDKQFLLQLGRVKDSFELDKMFFIINAADLADSMKELEEVIDHVSQQLQLHGIRNPRIYPISSRLALEARIEHNAEALERSGMQVFENSFATFAVEELAGVALRSAELELDKAMQAVRLGIRQSRLSTEQVQQNNEHRRSLLPIIQSEIESNIEQLVASHIRQELDELLYYVKQRCSFRFGDWYNDAFHPSALKEDGRNMSMALNVAWRQLQQSASIEVSQEVLATSLRMENYLRVQLRSWEARLLLIITERNEQFIAEEFILESFVTPEVGESIAQPVLDDKIFRKHFKSAKAFFEGDGKGQLRGVLHSVIDAAISMYVHEHEQQLGSYYEQLFIKEAHRVSAQLLEQLRMYSDGFTLNDNTIIDLIHIETRLARILH
ncbi:MAG: dynamin family protein [Paenibacillaceae bacterium]